MISQIKNENIAYNALKYKATILYKIFIQNRNLNTLNNSMDALNHGDYYT